MVGLFSFWGQDHDKLEGDTLLLLIVRDLFYNFWDFCTLISLNYDPIILDIFGKIHLPPVYLYEWFISEDVIETTVLTQDKAKSFFQQYCEPRSSRNKI